MSNSTFINGNASSLDQARESSDALLTTAGQHRRESMLGELLDSMDGIHSARRRRRRTTLAVAGCVVLLLGASALLAPMWYANPGAAEPDQTQFAAHTPGTPSMGGGEAKSRQEAAESQSGLVQRISKPSGSIVVLAVRTSDVEPVHSQTLTDETLVSTLEQLGHPAGIVRVGTKPAYVTGVPLTVLKTGESQDSSNGTVDHSMIGVQSIEA